MAQDKVQATLNGQELLIGDYNKIAAEAARADDLALGEMLRMAPYDGSTVTRGILPMGTRGQATSVGVLQNGTGGIVANPFRAVVSSRVLVATSKFDNLTDIRSAMYTDATPLALPAGAGTARVHLVYATIFVDVTTATSSLVKDLASKVVTPLPNTGPAHTYVTTSFVSATAPALPTIPADSVGVYNIPLAYVRTAAGYTLAAAVAPSDILDIAPVLDANFRHSVGVANQIFRTAPSTDNIASWAGGSARPTMYMPASMVGTVTRFIPFSASIGVDGVTPNVPFSGVVVDDSIDWRGRVFKATCQGVAASYGPWTGQAGSPKAGTLPYVAMGNSLFANASYASRLTAVRVNYADYPLPFVNAGEFVELYVNASNGKLMLEWNAAGTHAVNLFVWLEASSPFSNV